MKNFICIALLMLFFARLATAQGINFRTSITQASYSDEQWPGLNTTHPGYSAGLDVVIAEGRGFLMPGLHFQKQSIFPEKMNWKKPYAEFEDVKLLKLPVQVGVYLFDTKLADLKIHGGVIANFLVGMDTNDKIIEEDLNEVRGGFIGGASLRLTVLTFHANYEYGMSKVYATKGPSGIQNKSKERILSFGLGIYF